MSTWNPKANDIFLRALDLPNHGERERYLAGACRGEAALRAEVEALLEAGDAAGSFLESPALAHALLPTVDPSPAERPGVAIGPYKLLEQIGEGGFGIVYMAEQQQPVRRKVALKVLKPGMDTRQVIARFEAERQALALMDHPNIAKVLDAGATGKGRPFFVMELVKGVPITEYCDTHRLTPRERLEVFVSVCQAVQHAHQKGIIHRDIKPSNVLVTSHDGTPVVKVIDFGVAKAIGQQLTDKTLFTGFAQMIGTPLYMSPEQAELSGLDIDTRSDVYSLGVLLYELLTGTTPFDKEQLKSAAFDEIRRILREDEPPKPSTRLSDLSRFGGPRRTSGAASAAGRSVSQAGSSLASVAAQRNMEPRKLSQFMRGDLDWIVMKALEKDRNRRYETASGFARDVQRYLADEPVSACPPSALYRMRKLARRNKAAFAIGMAIAAALIVAVVALAVSNALVRRESDAKDLALRQKSEALAEKMAALKSARTQEQLAKRHAAAAEEQRQIAAKNAAHAETAREQANQNAAEAKSHEQLARRRLYAAQMELARQAWEKGIPGRVIELLENQRPRFDEEDLRGFEWYYLWGLCRARLRFSFAHPKARAVAISPDGKWLASGGADGVVAVWDLPGRKKFKDLQRRSYGWIYAVTFSPDGTALAAGEANGEVLLWDVATWRQTATLNTDDDSARVMCLAFSPDSKTLAMGGNKFRDMTRRSGGVIKLWDLPAGQLRATLDGHQHAVLSVAFSPSGDALASSSAWSSELKLWDLTSEPPQVAHAESGTGPVAFFPDQKRVAVANSTRVVIRDLATGAELAAGPPGQEQIMSLAVSPDGKQLAIGSDDRTLRFWEPESGRHTLFGHASTIESVAFTPDGASVAAASGDRITLWNTSDAATPQTGLNEYVAGGKASIVYSPDGKALAYATVNGGVKLRDRETLEERILLGSPGGNFEQIEFSHDGKRLAGRRSASMTIWDVDAAREIASLDGSPDSRLLALSPDGRSVTFHNGGQFNALNVWDVDTQTVRTIAGADAPTSMAYTADGKSLVLGTDIRIEVWNTDRWVRERVFRTNNFGVWFFSLSLTPDGKQAIASGKSGWLIALDVQTGKLLNTFKGHIGAVVCTAMFPDGKTLVSGSSDGTIKLWDLATGQERFSWIGHDGHGIVALAVHPGGREIASKGGEGLVRLWRAAQDEDGRAVKTELSADDPGSSAAWINDADALLRNRQFAAAEEAYRRADARLARLAVAFPQERQYTEARAQCLAGIASSLAGSGKPEKAIEYGQQALSLWLHLADDWQDAPLYVEEAAYVAGARLAPWLLQAKQPQAAEEALRRSLHLWDKAGSDAHLFGDDARLTCFQSLIALLNAGGRPDEADEVFRRLLEFEPARASCFNNFAWQLATAPEPRYRDAPRAVTLAKRATKLMDTEGMYWNTLGAAQYRAGEWQAAVEALNKSMKLRAGGDAFDWFFLALAHWRLGDMDEARRWHEQAVRWFEKNGTKNEELIRFRTEADELLATPDTGRSQKAADEHR